MKSKSHNEIVNIKKYSIDSFGSILTDDKDINCCKIIEG